MGKAARIRARHRAEERNEIVPNPHSLDTPSSKRNRYMRRSRQVTQRYDFHRNGTPGPSRPSAASWMENRSKRAKLRNGVSRGAPTRMRRRNDPRNWAIEPVKGTRRAAWRAQWTPGAIFRTLSGKRWVDLDHTRDTERATPQ